MLEEQIESLEQRVAYLESKVLQPTGQAMGAVLQQNCACYGHLHHSEGTDSHCELCGCRTFASFGLS